MAASGYAGHRLLVTGGSHNFSNMHVVGTLRESPERYMKPHWLSDLCLARECLDNTEKDSKNRWWKMDILLRDLLLSFDSECY